MNNKKKTKKKQTNNLPKLILVYEITNDCKVPVILRKSEDTKETQLHRNPS